MKLPLRGIPAEIPTGLNVTLTGASLHRMGTDTFTHTKSCMCGLGQIEATVSSPDHRWPSAYNVHWSYSIKCAPCSGEYMVDDHGLVFRRSEYAANRAAWDAWYKAAQDYEATPEIAGLKAEFAALLARLRTKKAAHEFLTLHGFTTDKYGTFTRAYRDAQSYAEGIHSSHAPTMARLLGKDPSPFQMAITALEAQRDAIPSVRRVMSAHPN